MIKELGSIGFYLKYENVSGSTYDLFRIYDSYDKDNLIASASINLTANTISVVSSGITFTYYINGKQSNAMNTKQWQHILISLSPKLSIYSSKDFVIEFGDTSNSTDIYIQNLYINNTTVQNVFEARMIDSGFNGSFISLKNNPSSASADFILVDYPEENYISEPRNIIYQPDFDQKRFRSDVSAAAAGGGVAYLDSTPDEYVLTADEFFVDGAKIEPGDRILALNTGRILEINNNGTFSIVSSMVGDLVYVLDGNKNKNKYFIKTTSSTWEETEASIKYSFIQSNAPTVADATQ